MANAIIGIGYALFAIPAGILGGRFGYRRMMMVGAFVCDGLSALLPVALFLSGTLQRIWLFATYGLYGTASALIPVNGVPYLMASSTDKERDHVFAFMGAVPAVAGFAGNLIGGLLPRFFEIVSTYSVEDAQPFAYSLWYVPVVYVLVIIALRAATGVKKSRISTHVNRATRPMYGIIVICSTVVFLRVSIFFSVSAFFNVYLDTVFHAVPSVIGILAAIGRLAAVPGAPIAPLLVSMWGRHRSVMILSAFYRYVFLHIYVSRIR